MSRICSHPSLSFPLLLFQCLSFSLSLCVAVVQANFTQLADTREISSSQLSVKHPEHWQEVAKCRVSLPIPVWEHFHSFTCFSRHSWLKGMCLSSTWYEKKPVWNCVSLTIGTLNVERVQEWRGLYLFQFHLHVWENILVLHLVLKKSCLMVHSQLCIVVEQGCTLHAEQLLQSAGTGYFSPENCNSRQEYCDYDGKEAR